MLEQFRTLRFKLTTSYVLIFGAIQVVLWVVVGIALDRRLQDRFDRDLLQTAQTLVEAFDAKSRDKPGLSPLERFREVIAPFESQDRLVLVRLRDTGEFVSSVKLRGIRLPYQESEVHGLEAPRFATIAAIPEVRRAGDRLRVVTLDVDMPQDSPYVLQVAASLGPLERIVTDIQRLLIVFVVVSLLVAGITSWLIARRSLAPIGLIARQARLLSAARLEKRIPVPPAGDEVSELVATFNDMLDRLETQFVNQQRFLSDVSHELKTPLAVLLAELQGQRKRVRDDDELVRFVDTLEEETRRMLRTVESLLILTRARATGRLEVVAEVSIEDVILKAVHHYSKAAADKGVRVIPEISSAPGMPEPIVSGDPDLLGSMVENLLDNAVRHSPEGATVNVQVSVTPKEAHLYVRDRGPGVPEQHRARIFEIFYQVRPGSDQAGKAGIGLAIVKAVAELHGGTVAAADREDGGAEFVVKLPLADPASGPAHSVRPDFF